MINEKWMPPIKIVSGIIVVYLILHFVFFKKSDQDLSITAPLVVVEQPKIIKMANYIYQTGNTVAFKNVSLVARIEGFLEKISFTDGTNVHKGTELFVIQPRPYLEQLKEAKASVKSAEASLAYTKSEYARQQRMFRENATSKNNVEVWLSKKEKAEADLLQSKANLVNAEINYGYTHVLAPFDGRIGRHLVDVGNLVGNGTATKLATIEQITPIYVYFNLNEIDVITFRQSIQKQNLSHSDIYNIPVYAGKQNDKGFPYVGKINFIDTGLDPTSGTLEIRALFTNKDLAMVPGLFVKVRIPTSEPKPRLTVPDTAISYDQIGAYLLTVDGNNVVDQKYVKLGPKEQSRQSIIEGLSAQDRVIVKGLQFATPGNKVRLKQANKEK